MALATITIQAFVQGLLSGEKIFGPGDIVSTAGIGQTTSFVMLLGDNTISVPAGSNAVIIRTPVTNTANLTLKGVGGDTGIRINKSGISVINFDPGAVPGSIIINSSAAQTGSSEFLFI